MKAKLKIFLIVLFISVTQFNYASNSEAVQLADIKSNWIEINDDISLRFIIESNKIYPEVRIKSESDILPSDKNGLIIFKDENNNISQFHAIRSTPSEKDGVNFLDILCEGNNDFLIDHNITDIFIRFGEKYYESHISKATGYEINKDVRLQAKKEIKAYKDFERISVGYDALLLNHGFGILNGVNLKYLYGFNVSKAPLFIELGVGISYNVKDYASEYLFTDWDGNFDRIYLSKQKLNSLSVIIPVNVSYKFNIGEIFSIQPYTGFNLTINTLLDQYNDVSTIVYWNEETVSGYNEIAQNKEVQCGWQIGLGFNINKVYVGVEYGLDFLPRASIKREIFTERYNNYSGDLYWGNYYGYDFTKYKLKSSRLSVSLGWNF